MIPIIVRKLDSERLNRLFGCGISRISTMHGQKKGSKIAVSFKTIGGSYA